MDLDLAHLRRRGAAISSKRAISPSAYGPVVIAACVTYWMWLACSISRPSFISWMSFF
ncbi:MAG: hypothetical protein HYS71_00040 [Candidatus Omnitrophica bacterium]|nr:hypothetical protein [Candidatus Omnitrophota bacterium]